ncbi:fucose kinase [Trypanosoma conorhini]|uniref:Fucose kinase n=1 Tax=Trypanosoma conorhini TaxID=83891 RepID=A0A3R7NJF1_9TRYP|nr:fucose kinase [Trypanosoma conorhini]RNF19290.1 fucose kinase [Trypanosoma conorhini]
MPRARVLRCICARWGESSLAPAAPAEGRGEKTAEKEGELRKKELPRLLRGLSLTSEAVERAHGLRSSEELAARAQEREAAAFRLLEAESLQQLTISCFRPSPQLSTREEETLLGRRSCAR